ncbi:hypothetical protein M9435_000646 [Picochlorum sp. BPE23]|nr:hypothetical protein M9435_000646 [Picochlorum sp. BPE23]
MEESVEEAVAGLFTRLEGQVKKHQSKRAIKTCDEILKRCPDDVDAVACKLASLIDLRKTEDALRLIRSKDEYMEGRFAFEYAYCLYRSGEIESALVQLGKVGAERAVDGKRLEGQLRYRLEEYKACIGIYQDLIREDDGIESKTNLMAAYAEAGMDGGEALLESMGVSPNDGFELAFNVACGMMATGLAENAREQLLAAHRIGEEMLFEEGLDDDEVAEELAGVDGQLAYLDALENNVESAMKAFEKIIDMDGPDDVANSAAAANLLLCQIHVHPHDRKGAQERLKLLEPYLERASGVLRVKSSLERRLGAKNCQSLLASYACGLLAANKIDHAREAVRSLETLYPGLALGVLMHAAILSRDGKMKEAISCLQGGEDRLKGSTLQLSAAALQAQLATHLHQYDEAAQLLGQLPAQFATKPSILATRAALYECSGDQEKAKEIAANVLQGDVDASGKQWALQKLGEIELSSGNLTQAAHHLLDLTKLDGASWEDPRLLNLLPRCIACCEPDRYEDVARGLEEYCDILRASDVDIDALESQAGNTLANTKLDADGQASKADEKKKKKKRKRKPRYPKGFDPENPGPPPDPERWLPKWQRAENKKMRKKKKEKDATRGSQGAGKVDASLDRTHVSSDAPAPKATHTGGRTNKKKKKGKGRR